MDTVPGLTELTRFLVKAKRQTYAGQDDDATVSVPLLDGSMQLEWEDGDWFYRDIYNGLSFFAGMEVVYFKRKPRWAMSYSGGVLQGVEVGDARETYAFLRSALMELPEDFPVRGPPTFELGNLNYVLHRDGDLRTFSGKEEVSKDGVHTYALSFAGGLIR